MFARREEMYVDTLQGQKEEVDVRYFAHRSTDDLVGEASSGINPNKTLYLSNYDLIILH
jgi:hypothetical protein